MNWTEDQGARTSQEASLEVIAMGYTRGQETPILHGGRENRKCWRNLRNVTKGNLFTVGIYRGELHQR